MSTEDQSNSTSPLESTLEVLDYRAELLKRKRFSKDEWEELCRWRQQMGEELSKNIYHLSNADRESDLQTYIDTINSYILEQDSEDNLAILEIAQSHFREKYGADIKNRGQSPELLDQIVHRTGAHTRDHLKKILAGFNAKYLANQFWDAILSKNASSLAHLEQELCLLTDKQKIELEFEFARIPAITIAEKLNRCFRADEENCPEYGILAEHELQSTFSHRSKSEIDQIIAIYDDYYHYDHTKESQACFNEALQLCFKGQQYDRCLKLLTGFNAEELGEQIKDNLLNCNLVLDQHEQHSGLHYDFAGNFREDYSDFENEAKEVLVAHVNNLLLEGVTQEQFCEISEYLSEKYEICLTPELYRCNQTVTLRSAALTTFQGLTNASPRRKARRDEDYLTSAEMQEVKKQFRLAVRADLSEMVRSKATEIKTNDCLNQIRKATSPLNLIDLGSLFDFEKYFQALSGFSLKKFVTFHVKRILLEEELPVINAEVELTLSCHRRLKLNPELGSLISQAKQSIIEDTQVLAEKTKELGSTLELIKTSLLLDKVEQNHSQKLIKVIGTLPIESLEYLELAYHRRFQRALLSDLRASLPAKVYLQLYLLLSGLKVKELSSAVSQSVTALGSLFHASGTEIECIISAVQKVSGKDKIELLREASELAPAECWRIATILMKPDANRLRLLVCNSLPFNDQNTQELLALLTKPNRLVLALEAAYNISFSSFAYCQSEPNFTFFEHLRVLANSAIISRPCFARSVLLMESVQPDIAETLAVLIDRLEASDKDGDEFFQVLDEIRNLFRSNSDHLPLIRKAFGALDASLNLRERIHNLRMTLTDRNLLLLFMDGYDPIHVASQIHELISNVPSENLDSEILTLLQDPRLGHENPLIPKHENWTGEMYQQIRFRYHQFFQDRLVTNLRRVGLTLKNSKLTEIANLLYGETNTEAFRLRKAVVHAQKSGLSPQIQQLLNQIFSEPIPALVERTIDLYEACFSTSPASLQIKQDLQQIIKDETLLQRLQNLIDSANNWDTLSNDNTPNYNELGLRLSQVA
jgi:hypothetical protein